MPNWVENNLEISGNEAEIKRFEEQAVRQIDDEKSVLSFDKFVPMPEELKNTTAPSQKPNRKLIKKYGADNWYAWSNHNWGTKWDASGAQIMDRSNGFIHYEFQTAWSLPMEWLIKAVALYPALKFEMEYQEEGMGFSGQVVAENGVIVRDNFNQDSAEKEEKTLFDEEKKEVDKK